MTRHESNGRPRVVWTPGETIALAVAATALAATGIVWIATHLVVLATPGRVTAFTFGDAAATTASLLLDPANPLAALPAARRGRLAALVASPAGLLRPVLRGGFRHSLRRFAAVCES